MTSGNRSRRPRGINLEVKALERRKLMTAAPGSAALGFAGAAIVRPGAVEVGELPEGPLARPALRRPPGATAGLRAATAGRRGPRRPEYDVAASFSYVGSPDNASVGINGFVPPSRATVPARPENANGSTYQEIGGVPYVYAIGRTEITAAQYVAFLNKVDPLGENPAQPYTGVRLWEEAFSPVLNPFAGQINKVDDAHPGAHYRLAADFWADKPLMNANLFQFAYFANSLYNGATVAIDDARARSPLGFPVRTQTRYISLSSQITTGMYDLQDAYYPFFERQDTSGYVIPSEDEWVKAAYYSPRSTGNGTQYYYYPTVGDAPPTPLSTSGDRPTVDALGNVIPANLSRGVAYANYDSQANWKPPYAPESSVTGANVVGVGGARTPSPWLTYDQAGNVVEFTDTITTPLPVLPNPHGLPVFVKAHGGLAQAPAWQVWLTATGTTDPYGQQAGLTSTLGGARFGYLPDARADRGVPTSRHAVASAVARPMASDGLVYRIDDLATTDLAEAVRLAAEGSARVVVSAGNP